MLLRAGAALSLDRNALDRKPVSKAEDIRPKT
jgi:hypothetical protein